MRPIKLLLCAIVACGAASPVSAQPENITAGELALTPTFCQDVQAINGWSQGYRESPRSPYWVGIMGSTFWAMHHYCWALVHLQRSRAPDLAPHVRAFMIKKAIADYAYVLNNAKPDFILSPEIHFRIGDAYVQLKEYPAAIDAFEKSRQAKVDYWPPYAGHADVLLTLGKPDEARKLLDEALKIMPSEPQLLRRVQALNTPAAARKPKPAASSPK